MRVFGQDPIRRGHHRQQPSSPHQQVEHMATPTSTASPVTNTLANGAPSTHGTKRTSRDVRYLTALGGKADIERAAPLRAQFEGSGLPFEFH